MFTFLGIFLYQLAFLGIFFSSFNISISILSRTIYFYAFIIVKNVAIYRESGIFFQCLVNKVAVSWEKCLFAATLFKLCQTLTWVLLYKLILWRLEFYRTKILLPPLCFWDIL